MTERDCKGCGGSGRVLTINPVDEGGLTKPCPACIGFGRVKDGPWRGDAMVDAETLRRVVRETGAAEDTSRALTAVAWQTINGSKRGLYDRARYAARAAFRAVPALRGDA